MTSTIQKEIPLRVRIKIYWFGDALWYSRLSCCPWFLPSLWIPVYILATPLLIQRPANVPRNGTEDSLGAWTRAHMWEMGKNVLTPGFHLAWCWSLWSFVKWTSEGKIFLSLIFSLWLLLSNKYIIKKNPFKHHELNIQVWQATDHKIGVIPCV